MKEPPRLVDGDISAFERAMLEAGSSQGPSATTRTQIANSLGIASVNAANLAASGATGAVGTAVGTAATWKWIGLGLIGGLLIVGASQLPVGDANESHQSLSPPMPAPWPTQPSSPPAEPTESAGQHMAAPRPVEATKPDRKAELRKIERHEPATRESATRKPETRKPETRRAQVSRARERPNGPSAAPGASVAPPPVTEPAVSEDRPKSVEPKNRLGREIALLDQARRFLAAGQHARASDAL